MDAIITIAEAASINVNDSNLWSASNKCDRIRIGTLLFSKPSGGSFGAVNNSNFNWVTTDTNLSMVITDGGEVWRFNSSINGFAKLYAPSGYSYPSGSRISVYDNRFTVAYMNATSAMFLAYTSNETSATECFYY